MSNSSSIYVTNYHAVSPVYASSDGFNIISSHDVAFNNVFIYSCDDAVSVMGHPASSYDLQANPVSYESVFNINFKNSQLWADDSNGMVVSDGVCCTISCRFDLPRGLVTRNSVKIWPSFERLPSCHDHFPPSSVCALSRSCWPVNPSPLPPSSSA